MSMPAYDATLPAGTASLRDFEYGFDVFDGPAEESKTAAVDDSRWVSARRALNINPAMTPIQQDEMTNDDLGSPNSTTVAWSWVLTSVALLKKLADGSGKLIREQQVLQARFGDAKGEDAKVGVRWYDKPSDGSIPDPNEAFQGVGTVALVNANPGVVGASRRWTVTITGAGYAWRISNPFTGWAGADTTPVITSVTPAGQSVGEIVRIDGSALSGVTGVTIDSLPADFQAAGGTVFAVIPATAAGDAPVIVTTAAGASAAVSYTVA